MLKITGLTRPSTSAGASGRRCSAPPARTRKASARRWCMEAASVDELMADVRQAGLEIARGPIKRRDGTSLFLSDPDGVRVELQLFD